MSAVGAGLSQAEERREPRGAPALSAIDAAGVWSRAFATGTKVWFDSASGAGRIEWADGTVDQGAGAPEAGPPACKWLAAAAA